MTWNCLGKTATSLEHLLSLRPDVAVMVESGPVVGALSPGLTWTTRTTIAGSPKHIVALAIAPWVIRPHPLEAGSPPWVLPVQVEGPIEFTLLAVHTFVTGGQPSYPAQVAAIIESLLPSLNGDVLIAGDFNVPIRSTLQAHIRNDEALRSRGLRSAFLASRGATATEAYADAATRQGVAWREPTYYHHRHPTEGFHIDHVYAPTSWMSPRPQVVVGTHTEWVASGRSDHVPLQVDFAPASTDAAR